MRTLSAVHLSVKRVNCDKTEEKSIQILYYTKDHLADFQLILALSLSRNT